MTSDARTPESSRLVAAPVIASSVTVLFAARLPAWLIALSIVVADTRPADNLGREPTLLAVTLAQVAVTIAYAPLLRRRVLRRLGLREGARVDLLVLSALDMALVFAVLYLSGGFNTPYYHFAIVALLVPAFLLGWVGSLAVLVAFVAALIVTWSVAGGGTDLWFRREQFGGPIPGLLVTPVLVVVVAQYLAWVVRWLEDAYARARRALNETTALYAVARAVQAHERPRELAREVVAAIGATERFPHLSVWELDGETLRPLAAFGRSRVGSSAVFIEPGEGELPPLRRLRLDSEGESGRGANDELRPQRGHTAGVCRARTPVPRSGRDPHPSSRRRIATGPLPGGSFDKGET